MTPLGQLPAQPTPRHLQAGALPFVALLAALAWAPWPLASNRPWALGLLAIWIWLALLGCAVGRVVNKPLAQAVPIRPLPWAVWLPTGYLLGFALLAALQLVPGLGGPGRTLSIDPFATQGYLLATLVYAGAWLLVLLTVNTAQRVRALLLTVVGAGMVQAFVAVLLHASRASYMLFDTPFEQGSRASGTFANPDHLAGYMELCLSAAVGYVMADLAIKQPQRAEGWRGGLVAALHFALSPKMLVRVLMVVMVVALVMTHSRMGNGAFFLSLLLGGGLIALASQALRRPALWLVASMAVVDIFIIGQWVGLDRVVERMSDTAEASRIESMEAALGTTLPPPREESLAQRLQVPRLSLALVADKPWLGHGGGTYYTAFPPYKQAGLPWHWDHAHNDYVQVAADMGLVGLALWVGIGLASAWRALALLRWRPSPEALGMGAASLLALLSLGLHTLVDFNLHITANAFTFTVLLAAVWAVPATAQRRSRGQRRPEGAP